ncbi:MAG: type I restriction-modification system subunit M [Paludibacteraceae bacterium]|nr:type I restriction-modification system subunit M [Paludibacteraceae bacterium]
MNQTQHSQLVSFIWNIANDVLVQKFERGTYKNIILPMMVLRRLDVLLEDSKTQVLEALQKYSNISNIDPIIFNITKLPYYNTSKFTLKSLLSETDPQRLKKNFIDYKNGYSEEVRDILEKFKFDHIIDDLTNADRLGSIIEKFTSDQINLSNKPVLNPDGSEKHPALDNHSMGTVFEELLRRFNEENNVTEAGEHFTPRDYVKLLADCAIMPVKDQLKNNTYSIYDGACGTGGILSISKERIEEVAKEMDLNQVNIRIYGQENQPETYATCKSDLLINGENQKASYSHAGQDRHYIAYGSTLSEDGHKGETYDFCISNPPFGTPWKEDLKVLDIAEKKKNDWNDPRFKKEVDGEVVSFIPNIGDPQMLFLANNLSRMKETTELGTRIVEIHNGSSLFTGGAGSGESNLRKYIIENDLLEAIIAMPENSFYNTGIGTYIWIVTNRKEERRHGKVQLIDATSFKTALRKNLGHKNCETNEEDRKKIVDLLMKFEENEYSKIFPNEEFGYWEVKLMRPEKDENGNIVTDKKGKPKMKKDKDTEQVPLTYPGGIAAFYENEVKPYDAEVVFGDATIGYELSFTKYFYKPVELETLESLRQQIMDIEADTDGLLNDILGI